MNAFAEIITAPLNPSTISILYFAHSLHEINVSWVLL